MKFFCLFRGKSRLLKTIPYIIFPGSPSTPWQARGQPSGADHHQTSPSGAQQHHFSISFAVMNNYQAAAAAQAQAQGFGPPASPHTTGARAGFPAANSPGPTIDMYNSSGDSVGYVQAASPQPSSFPAIAVSRAPLNYSPVSFLINFDVCINKALLKSYPQVNNGVGRCGNFSITLNRDL